MTVLLKNLVARVPTERDFAALANLVRLCAGSAVDTDTLLERLRTGWQGLDFHLTNDAWVIVTTTGDLVGFASVWYEEPTRLATFLCVHPEYRKRGVGTLLLRMVEAWARQQVRLAASKQRVVLQGVMSTTSQADQRLFEREGYQAGRSFLRISFAQHGENEQQDLTLAPRQRVVDIVLGPQAQPFEPALLGEQDGLCSVSLYRVYEKELRPAISNASSAQIELQALSA